MKQPYPVTATRQKKRAHPLVMIAVYGGSAALTLSIIIYLIVFP